MTHPTPKQTSQARRRAMCSALALTCVLALGACVGSNPRIQTSKQQGDNSTATDETNSGIVGKLEAEIAALKVKLESEQTVQQSGIFNFAKQTSSALVSGGSVLFAMMTLFYMNHRAHGAIVRDLVDVIRRMIPLVNADDHRQNIAFDPGFGSPSLPGSQERKTGGANLSAQKSAGNV